MNTRLPENIRAMWTDAYKLHETLYGIGRSPDEWLRCCEIASRVTIKHGEHPLIVALASAVFEQLERESCGT